MRYLSQFATQYLACLSVVTKKHLRGGVFEFTKTRRSSCTNSSEKDHCHLRLHFHSSYHPAFLPHVDYICGVTYDSAGSFEEID